MKQKAKTHLVSLIIPVYKQERTILQNVKTIKEVLENTRYDYEILPVIDGFTDKSFQILKKAKLNKVKPLAYLKNQGKGYAIRYGMSKANGDYVMFIDAGMEINPNAISMLLEHMEWYDADVIVGSKRHPVSRVNYTGIRKLLSMGYYMGVKILFGLNIHDTQAGIKIFKRRVLKAILPKLLEKKFCADLEMLVASKQLGFGRIYEAPIKLDYNLTGVSSAATWNAILIMVINTLAIFYRAKLLKYYNRPNVKSY